MGGMERIKGEMRERQSDTAENHDQHSLYLGGVGAEEVGFVIEHVLCRSSEWCFLLRRGAHFQKNHEKVLPESEKWSQNCVGYMKIPPRWGWSDISLKAPNVF